MLKDKVLRVRNDQKVPAILVIGDLMVDHYIFGSATRLSPEAPVPVVNVKNESNTPGGAANVAQNLVSLGASVMLAGIIGDDVYGSQLKDILNTEGIKTDGIITDANRPTTVKTRVMAGSHQLVRVDREITDAVNATLEDELVTKLSDSMENADIVVFSDYNKGLFSPALTQRLLEAAKL